MYSVIPRAGLLCIVLSAHDHSAGTAITLPLNQHLFRCAWLFGSDHIVANDTSNVLTFFPTDVAFMRVRNEHQPLFTWFFATSMTWFPTFVAQHVFSLAVCISSSVNRAGDQATNRSVRRSSRRKHPRGVSVGSCSSCSRNHSSVWRTVPSSRSSRNNQRDRLLDRRCRYFSRRCSSLLT